MIRNHMCCVLPVHKDLVSQDLNKEGQVGRQGGTIDNHLAENANHLGDGFAA
jgi:hypothetical protein